MKRITGLLLGSTLGIASFLPAVGAPPDAGLQTSSGQPLQQGSKLTPFPRAEAFALIPLAPPTTLLDHRRKEFRRNGSLPIPKEMNALWLNKLRPVRIQVVLEVEGKPLADQAQVALQKLFAYVDRNADGYLNSHESELIFSKTEMANLRQGGYAYRGSGELPKLERLDRDGDGRVSRDEFIEYYSAEIAKVLTARAVPTTTIGDGPTHELFARLDKNKDSKLSQEELSAAPRLIEALDTDEDETVSLQELLANPVASTSVAAAGGNTNEMMGVGRMPDNYKTMNPVDIQIHASELPGAIVQQVIKKYDKDDDYELSLAESGFDAATFRKIDMNNNGKLSATELDAWRVGPPDLVITLNHCTNHVDSRARFAPVPKDSQLVVSQVESNRVSLRVGPQMLDFVSSRPVNAQAQPANPYAYLWPAGKTFVEEKDLPGPQNQYLRIVFDFADHDGDGKLTREEFDKYFELQSLIRQLGFVVPFSSRQPNMFHLFDTNGDGRLSLRELRSVYTRLKGLEPSGSESLTKEILQPVSTIRFGPTLVALTDATASSEFNNYQMTTNTPRQGPIWFRKMDRNGDGDVSRLEFLGSKADFDAIDTNKDGLISLEEAQTFDEKARKK